MPQSSARCAWCNHGHPTQDTMTKALFVLGSMYGLPYRIEIESNRNHTINEHTKTANRTSRQTQTGIGLSTPMHSGGQVQTRIKCWHQRHGRNITVPRWQQPRLDSTGRNAEEFVMHIYSAEHAVKHVAIHHCTGYACAACIFHVVGLPVHSSFTMEPQLLSCHANGRSLVLAGAFATMIAANARMRSIPSPLLCQLCQASLGSLCASNQKLGHADLAHV